ncbi:MAG: transglycosylase SLT domain-containing protein [Lentisphaeria bacterium]|jgi:soluble lytic murein transglycosylase|nr:transglycosylase SLT domain-containing protein [Lentisphaeria bacterium]MDY0176612.1 transglycosylase SLT domain-containing protein [Lentisphaeria bacterium]NLZ60894.1 lytic transglycosylase domain-containing protein [Lentisphaerota bacterium]
MAKRQGGKTLLFLMLFLMLASFLLWRFYQSWVFDDLEQREKLFAGFAEEAAARHQVDPALVKAIIWKESRWLPGALGSHGEIGLMQITLAAVEDWSRLQKQKMPKRAELFQPELNIEIGTWYLSWTLSQWSDYKSAEILQIAAYNAGHSRVSKLWRPESPELELDLEQISFPGTRDYIKQVLARKQHYRKSIHEHP